MLEKMYLEDGLMQKQENSSELKNRTFKEFCVSSKCDDGHHILIWDFDHIDKEFVLRSLSMTQHANKLGDIYG